jgi:hypothetical protein
MHAHWTGTFLPFHFQVLSSVFSIQIPNFLISAVTIEQKLSKSLKVFLDGQKLKVVK